MSSKYPIVLVHGIAAKQLRILNAFGKIGEKLEEEGYKVYVADIDGFGSIENNAEQLKEYINGVLDETGAEKVNIIAHSKGGLEARMAVSSLGMGKAVASITTVGTPHRGSKTVDRLLKAPDSLFNIASFAVNNWIGLIGDTKPNFYAVCRDFSTDYAEQFNRNNPDVPGVYYQSFAGVMKTPLSDINLSTAYSVVKMIEGENDGLVSVESAEWGESFTVLRGQRSRGVSHLDEIDFRRTPFLSGEELNGISDICDVYRGIVQGLRERGF